MDNRKKIMKKIVPSRRLLNLSKVLEEANGYTKDNIRQMNEILPNTVDISFASEKMCWSNERSPTFWEIQCQLANEAFFKDNFRMSRRLFYKLCELLQGLRKCDTKMGEAIPFEKRIAIAVYTLGSSEEYRTIAILFRVEESTVGQILLSFVAEVWKVLTPMYMKNFPMSKGKMEVLVKEFEALGFPQCMGAIGGCHFEIHPPHEDDTDFYNSYGWRSTALLALVDARCRFLYVSCGSPGRCTDSEIFMNSSLKKYLDKCSLLKDLKRTISGVDVPVLIIGDSGFRLSESIMKPYPLQKSKTYPHTTFNNALSKCRRVVKDAFVHLKARFPHIGNGIENSIRNATAIILSCCALHNFLNENNDQINEEWLEEIKVRSHPKQNNSLRRQGNNPEEIRNAIATYLALDNDAADANRSDGNGAGSTGS